VVVVVCKVATIKLPKVVVTKAEPSKVVLAHKAADKVVAVVEIMVVCFVFGTTITHHTLLLTVIIVTCIILLCLSPMCILSLARARLMPRVE
jgi:hypothetical protein